MLIILLTINPFSFGLEAEKGVDLLVITVFFLTVFFPLISTFMMKFLGLIKSIKMEDRKERIGPLVVSGIFYLWLFVNIKGNPGIPTSFSFFVLGATISLFTALMFNSFTRVSLHAIGMGGLLMGLILIKYTFSYSTFLFEFMDKNYIVNTNLVLYIIILATGAVGTSRLLLNAHEPRQVYWGYLIGMIAQMIAFRIYIL